MSSCSVTENNTAITDTWVGETSATHTSSPIGEQTVYTLRCVGLDSSVETRDAIVNVVPVWQEQ
jgi:hypothetical protein